jgi:putative transposase
MGSVGDFYDNAMCQSFFATLECELLEQHRIDDQREASLAHRGLVQSAATALIDRHAVTRRSDLRNSEKEELENPSEYGFSACVRPSALCDGDAR